MIEAWPAVVALRPSFGFRDLVELPSDERGDKRSDKALN